MSAIVLVLFAAYIFAGPILGDPYPLGSGRHSTSPDGRWEAHALNMSDEIYEDKVIHYFEFSIVDNRTGEPIVKHRFPEGDHSVEFRQGNGLIQWSDDSRRMTFGSDQDLLWEFEIPELGGDK